jgi:lipopolysaccharide transport system permease protein
MKENKTLKYHSHISSKHRLLSFNLKEVWHYKDLIWLFTKRDFVVKYKQTILGPAWLFLNPLISSLMYAFVFGGIAGIGTDGVPSIMFYLVGNTIWTYFSTSLTTNANTFTSNSSVFGKVYFPRLTVPLANVLSNCIQFAIQMCLVCGFMVFYIIRGEIHPVWWAWLLIPVILVHLGFMSMGFGIIISSLTTKYRDLSVLVTFGVQLWMYITPVVYPLSQVGNGIGRTLLLLNPVTSPIEVFRYAVLGVGTIEPLFLTISCCVTAFVTVVGIIIFNKVERTFMDTV